MDQERHRFVQQYVERQKAYLPTYTMVDLLTEPDDGGPLKPPQRSDEYGFDTPVLRPRVPVKPTMAQPALQTSKSQPRTRKADRSNQVAPTSHRDEETDLTKKSKPRTKRKKDPTPIVDTDDERAARLADRRERKRRKRAIVDPRQTCDDDAEPTAAPKKGKTNGQKVKKPAALALLYGFSVTNVTKDRLTLKPAPSLGVFNKGKASEKKKVASTKRASSRNDLFSESAFLNKSNSNERVADTSKLDDNSDEGSVSSVPSVPQEHGKKNIKCPGPMATNAPQTSTRTAAGSEVWDIELQSKLPSSVCDVSSEPRAESSAPVILDLRGAEWSASLSTAEKPAEHPDEVQTPSMVATQRQSEEHSMARSSPFAVSSLRNELGLAFAADVSSIHPSHSASQVGARTDTDLCLVGSKYFVEHAPVPDQELPAILPQASGSIVGIEAPDFRIPGQDVRYDVETIRRTTSPVNSLVSRPQSMVHFQTRYDTVPLELPRDSSPYEGFCADVDARWDPLGRLERGYVELHSNLNMELPCHRQPQGGAWDWSQLRSSSAGIDIDDVDMEATCDDPLASECADHFTEPKALIEACDFERQAESDPEEEQDGWYCAGDDLPIYEDEIIGGVYDVSLNGEEDVSSFLEGRALLLGIPEAQEGGMRCVGLSGLVQAEMDVANRLRDHWRPLRL